MEIRKYIRKPEAVEAVQVTTDNMDEVAIWSKGQMKVAQSGDPYIKLKHPGALNHRQTMAFVGDWVVRYGQQCRVYLEKTFPRYYNEVVEESTTAESVSVDADTTVLVTAAVE